MIQETFVETCWEEEAVVRQRRDARRQELEASGMECRSENFHTVDGRRVFVVFATAVTELSEVETRVKGTNKIQRTIAPRPRPNQRKHGYEVR
jgi:hypothetical protein